MSSGGVPCVHVVMDTIGLNLLPPAQNFNFGFSIQIIIRINGNFFVGPDGDRYSGFSDAQIDVVFGFGTITPSALFQIGILTV